MATQSHQNLPTNTRVEVLGHHPRVVEVADGASVASVSVAMSNAAVRVHFTLSRAPLPKTTRRDLVEAIFRLPELRPGREVQVALPLGDVELLGCLQDRLDNFHTRAAGVTCLIDATTRQQDALI